MIKYISTSNFDKIENRVLSHPDKPYETNDYIYWLEYCYGGCGRLKRKAKDNSSGHTKDKIEIVAYYNKGTWNNENVTFIRTGRDRPQEN